MGNEDSNVHKTGVEQKIAMVSRQSKSCSKARKGENTACHFKTNNIFCEQLRSGFDYSAETWSNPKVACRSDFLIS
jgi:hypothetical protein